MSYQEEKDKRVAIFEDTIGICEREQRLMNAIQHTREHTTIWRESSLQLFDISDRRYDQACEIELSNERTLEKVKMIKGECPDCRIAILNCMSPIYPGGAVLRGGDTMEERYCRCSTLYPSLRTDELEQVYYDVNRVSNERDCVNSYIYTPDVVFFKENEERPILMKEKDWFSVDIISSAFPDNITETMESMEETEDKMEKRKLELLERWMEGILSVAAKQKIDILVLDAAGCRVLEDVSQNMVSVLKKALQEYTYSFRAIHFLFGNAEDYPKSFFSSSIS